MKKILIPVQVWIRRRHARADRFPRGGGEREAYGVRPACRRFGARIDRRSTGRATAAESGSELRALHTLRAHLRPDRIPHRGKPTSSGQLRVFLALFCLAAAAATVCAQPVAPTAISLGAYTQPLKAPARVAVDAAGFAYVTDAQAGQVVMFDPFGHLVRTDVALARPLAIAVDNQGRIFLSDAQTGSVNVFDAQHNFLYQLGVGAGEFQLPNHIALDPAAPGTVYVADSKANLIKVYAGPALAAQFGGAGSGNGQFDFPAGICVSAAGEVFVVDQNNDRVQVFDRAGNFLRLFSLGGASSAPSGRSQGAVVDGAGRLYVADAFQGMVNVFDAASGARLSSMGGFGQLPGQLNSPVGLALDAFNRLFVASASNRRLELYGLDSFVQLTASSAAGPLLAGTNLVLSATTGGAGVSSWQWLRNGIAIPGATNGTLALSNVAPADSGAYSVVMTGPSGTLVSGATQVAVLLPPTIISGPENLTVMRGTDVILAVSASGSDVSYQWLRGGQLLDGATNSTLALLAVDATQAGSYSAIVKTPVGLVATAPAQLSVLTPPMVMEILTGSFGPDQLFHLTINTDLGATCAVEATTDFAQWQVMGTNFNDLGIFDFPDPGSTNASHRNYRLRWVP